MEQRDVLYLLFWPFAVSAVLYFAGYLIIAAFFFAFSIVGIAFAEKIEKWAYAAGAAFLALAFMVYFFKSFEFIAAQYMVIPFALIFPAVLLEVRKLRK